MPTRPPPVRPSTGRAAAADSRQLAELSVTLERTLSWLRRVTRPVEWSAVAVSALDALDRQGPLRVTELVSQERISQPGMTGLVGRLADAGLVDRHADPRDGRVTLVQVTDAGRNYLRSVHDQRAETLGAHLRQLAAMDQRALLAAAAALRALASQPSHDQGR